MDSPLTSDDRCGGHNHPQTAREAGLIVSCRRSSVRSLSEMRSYVAPALLTLFDGRLALFIGANWLRNGANGITAGVELGGGGSGPRRGIRWVVTSRAGGC